MNATTAERDADLGRGAVLHDNAVVVRRVAEPLAEPVGARAGSTRAR